MKISVFKQKFIYQNQSYSAFYIDSSACFIIISSYFMTTKKYKNFFLTFPSNWPAKWARIINIIIAAESINFLFVIITLMILFLILILR